MSQYGTAGDTFKAVCIGLVVLVLVFGFTWIKVAAYDGNISCLFVHCVKIIP